MVHLLTVSVRQPKLLLGQDEQVKLILSITNRRF
jgi:hypothetical protein